MTVYKKDIRFFFNNGCLVSVSVLSKVFSLDQFVRSTNLENGATERQRKKESRRQASETQRKTWRQRSRARDKQQRRHFFCWKNNDNFVAAVRK